MKPRLLPAIFLSLHFVAAARGAVTPWSLAINTNNVIVATNAAYGAVGDGIFTNTTAIQNAINAAAAGGLTNGLRGGLVEIPSGTFLCGPLTLKSNVRLQINSNAIVRALPYESYPGAPYTSTVASLISGASITNIAVTGAGLIDGQGEPWWRAYETNSGLNRPAMVYFPSCSRVLLQDFTSTNPPNVHVAIKGANAGSVNFIGIKLFAPDSADLVNPSHNTDGIDFAETNAVFQDCFISTGDDNIAIGSSGSVSADMLVTNCFFGNGHGLSIGSYTSGGVSNLTVISCTFSNTGNGIKVKSQRGRGGMVQNLNYFNITMTNVSWPLQFYSYYEYGLGTLTTLTPAFVASVATNTPPGSSPPIFRNITISNLTANIPNGRPPFLIWGLPDYPISNLIFKAVKLNSSSTRISGIYNATNIQFIDCLFTVPAGVKTFQFWNAATTFTNTSATTNLLFLDGLTTNGVGSTFGFYNALATVSNTNAIAGGAITLGGSTLTASNNLTLTPANPLNFIIGTNPATLAVKGKLALGGSINVVAGPGFTNGNYTLVTYTGSLSGSLPTLGATPAGYSCSLSSATANQITLIVSPPPAGIPTNLTASATNLLINLKWFTSSNAASYNLKRSTTNDGPYSLLANLTTTNYSDATVNPGTAYYYVVSATNSAGESADSIQASAIPLPSNLSTNLNFQTDGNQLQLSWPADHLGWRLESQTNTLDLGLGTNWVTVPGSNDTNQMSFPFGLGNGSVFFRLNYP
jgi:hypothetical protein